MSVFDSRFQTDTTRVARSGCGVLLLTILHHAFGAYIYNTPWRLHVVFIAAAAASTIIGLAWAMRRWHGTSAGKIASVALVVITLAIPIGLIGLFEGGYNHALKNALYFAGASSTSLHRLFPPPTYEMPNDLLFEITGVVQLVAAMVTVHHLYRSVDEWRQPLRTCPEKSMHHRTCARTQ